ncbi:MAG: heavy metal translocating P-type ATPase, partial [Calditrichaeota bacterium]
MVEDFRRRFWISLVLTIPVVLFSPMIQSFLGLTDLLRFEGSIYISFIFSVAVYFYGGYPFLKGFGDEIREKQPGMMTLIALAITVAFVYSSAVVFGIPGRIFFWEVATLIDVMLLGHWIEMRSVMGASKALEKLARLMPSEAHKLQENGDVEDVSLDELRSGDRVLVKPGEKIPADGKIVEGESSINEAMVTGESRPVTRKEGDEVIGGSVNGEGSITVKVEKTGEDSFLSRVVKMVEEAQKSKSHTQNLADRAAFWLTIIALTAGTVTLIAWLAFMNSEFVFALERTVTVMVITCPHALGLAIPLVVAVSTAISAQNGLLIRNRAPFERARNLDAIIFDKTGTLTRGTFEVTDVMIFKDNINEKELVRLAASVEQHSEHPIARGIVEYSDNTVKVTDFQAITGKGARGKVENQVVKVVSEAYLRENNIQLDNQKINDVSQAGKTMAFVLIDD